MKNILPSLFLISFLASTAHADLEKTNENPREAPDASLIQTPEWKWKSLIFNDEPRDYDLRGEYRFRFDSLSEPFRKGGEPQKEFLLFSRTRVRFSYFLPSHFQTLIELQDSRAFFQKAISYINNTGVNTFDIQQAFVSYRDNQLTDQLAIDAQAGRINMDLGRRRLIARTDFSNTTNAFDGLHFKLSSKESAWNLRGFVMKYVEKTMDEFDHFWRGPLLDGLSFEKREGEARKYEWNVYFIHLEDALTGANKRIYYTPGARFQKLAGLNDLDFEAEFILQYGTKGTVEQKADYLHGELGYTFGEVWSTPQLQFLYDYGSATFDALYGERRFDFTPISIFGPFSRTNIMSPGARVVFKPLKDTKVTLRYRQWKLADAKYSWAGSGLTDATGNDGNDLGADYEIRGSYDLTENISFDSGWDYLSAGAFRKKFKTVLNNPTVEDSNYVYFQGRIKF